MTTQADLLDGAPALFGDGTEGKALTAPPADDVADGVMIALYPDEATAAKLAALGVTPAAELHVTVAYAGKTDAVELDPLLYAADAVTDRQPVSGQVSGIARFTGGADGDVLVALVDSADLERLRRDLVDALADQQVTLPADHGYTAHCTLGYLDPGDSMPVDRIDAFPVTFGALSVVYGSDRTDIPFGAEDAPPADGLAADTAAPTPTPTTAPLPAETKIHGGSQTPTGGAMTVPALSAATPPTPPEYTKPHPYVRDPQSGAGNCVCGATQGDPIHIEAKAAFKGAAAPFGKGGFGGGKGKDAGPQMATGAFVQLGGKKGRVDMVVTSGTVPDAKSSGGQPVEGSKDSPAARVVLYEATGAGTWKATKNKVASSIAKLKRIPPLRTRQGKSLEEDLAGLILDHDVYSGVQAPAAGTLRTVYERGAASWPGETKTLLTAQQWGLGRAEAFLATVAGDRPDGYVGDDDLL